MTLATTCYIASLTLERINHRTLRNESGRILKEAENRATFIITNKGRDVAELHTVSNDPLVGHKYTPANPNFSFTSITPVKLKPSESGSETLQYLRGE